MNTNKVAVITGGARRLGAAMAKRLHSKNYNLLLHYRNSQAEAEELASSLNRTRPKSVHTVQADLQETHSSTLLLDQVEKHWGRCDLLVNNASAFYPKALGEYCEKDWDTLVGSNMKAPFFLTQALRPLLKANQGQVINLLDISAFKARKHFSLYCMAKAASAMMTQALALELAPEIRVNGIAPGAILWPEDKEGNELVNTAKLADIPLGRLGGSESICETLMFLVDYSSYITGEIIHVDGGQSVK